jgi:hypothetical protein
LRKVAPRDAGLVALFMGLIIGDDRDSNDSRSVNS